MTMPPKARLFRISREESILVQARGQSQPTVRRIRIDANPSDDAQAAENYPFSTSGADDGFGDRRFPGAAGAAPVTPADPADPADDAPADSAEMAAIRAENLTSRQLRMAARIAAMHQIEAESELDAVLQLRRRGIDPFHRAELGKILASEGDKSQRIMPVDSAAPPARPGGAGVPMRLPRQPGELGPPRNRSLPQREEMTEERRAAEILRIQRDIARRRRRSLMMLAVRLMIFVGIPTIVAGFYFLRVATPLYATHSQFLIQQAEQSGAGGLSGLGGLFSGTQLATNSDSVTVQSYLTSRAAMLRLEEELGFKQAFQGEDIDPILRLPDDATNEQVYKLYRNSVKIGYDPTEGVLNMEVIAPDPALSQQFSVALIKYAEGQVDQMTSRLREDQMKGSIESYQDAENKVQIAQQNVLELQEKLGVLDPVAEGTVIMTEVAEMERQLRDKRLELGQLQANANPNRSRVAGVQGDIRRIEEMLEQTRSRLTEGNAARGSLASITGQIRIAESDLRTRQELLATAAAQMEVARIEANKQVRYLSISVAPVAPDEATYPKAFQNTIVAFLIFSGVYLMLSLTASILREQVSS